MVCFYVDKFLVVIGEVVTGVRIFGSDGSDALGVVNWVHLAFEAAVVAVPVDDRPAVFAHPLGGDRALFEAEALGFDGAGLGFPATWVFSDDVFFAFEDDVDAGDGSFQGASESTAGDADRVALFLKVGKRLIYGAFWDEFFDVGLSGVGDVVAGFPFADHQGVHADTLDVDAFVGDGSCVHSGLMVWKVGNKVPFGTLFAVDVSVAVVAGVGLHRGFFDFAAAVLAGYFRVAGEVCLVFFQVGFEVHHQVHVVVLHAGGCSFEGVNSFGHFVFSF